MLEMMAKCASLKAASFTGCRFEGQRSNNDCIVTAAINACRYAGVEPPDYDALMLMAESKTQKALDEMLAMTGLDFEVGYNDQIAEHGCGIMIVEPRPQNPHAVFAFTHEGQLHLVNSGLSKDLVVTIDPKEIPEAKYPGNKGWILHLPEGGAPAAETEETEDTSPDESGSRNLLSNLRVIAASAMPVAFALHSHAVELCCAAGSVFYRLKEQGGMFEAEGDGEPQPRPELQRLRQALLHATGVDPMLVEATDFFNAIGCSPVPQP